MSMALVEHRVSPPRTRASSLRRPRASSYASHGLPRCISDAQIRELAESYADLSSPSSVVKHTGANSHNNISDVDYKELAALWHTASSFPLQFVDREETYDPGTFNSQDFDHHRPFHKWMRTLRNWTNRRPTIDDQPSCDDAQSTRIEDRTNLSAADKLQHQKSPSGSSFGFVAAVRSASVSIAGTSLRARSRRNNTHSRYSRTDRSSRASWSGPRISEDGVTSECLPMFDLAAAKRALQRRRILEELISTEEHYIADIRFLTNVYLSVLASLPALSLRLRQSVNDNLAEILTLHNEILGELYRIVPDSGLNQHYQTTNPSQTLRSGHERRSRRSLDAIAENRDRMPWLQGISGMASDSQVAAEVAKVFTKKMNRFFIYKEYGAKYEMMIHDIVSDPEIMPTWYLDQRGLEVLGSGVQQIMGDSDEKKKGRSIADLLVKPIQRLCRYPLLFAELLKYTPASDCPNSHMEIETALMRLREATAEINHATDDDDMKAILAKTWLLQDRLVFPDRKLDAASKAKIRSFGYIQLCGALHVCWPTESGVNGRYLICLLYRDFLCLACASKVDPIYTVQAVIVLNGTRVEDADDGRGLQCHTASFSWKVVFKSDHQLYEMIMTACTSEEETQWRKCLHRPSQQDQEVRDPDAYSYLSLNMKGLGPVFGKQGTIARRLSIHRALTLGSRSPRPQVILRHTNHDGSSSHRPSSALHRSKSLSMASSKLHILTPSRKERARLELLLADVWSRNILPFPGMSPRTRSELQLRRSTSTMVRKISLSRRSSTSQIRRSIGGGSSLRGLKRSCKTLSKESLRSDQPINVTATKTSDGSMQRDDKEDAIREEEVEASKPEIMPLSEKLGPDGLSNVVLVENILEDVEEALSSPILRVSHPNKLNSTENCSSLKPSSQMSNKENARQSFESTTRITNRPWTKVGSIRGETKGHHGFRSLFR